MLQKRIEYKQVDEVPSISVVKHFALWSSGLRFFSGEGGARRQGFSHACSRSESRATYLHYVDRIYSGFCSLVSAVNFSLMNGEKL